jgi:anti-sigma B factor antagonist
MTVACTRQVGSSGKAEMPTAQLIGGEIMGPLDGQVKDCCPVRWLEHGRLAVAAMPEHFDLPTAGPIREQLLTVINRGARTLIVDMTATIACDHAGVAALARVYQRAAASSTELRLVVSAPVVRRVLDIGHIDRLVSIYPVLEAALASAGQTAIRPLVPAAGRAGSAVPEPRNAAGTVPRLPAGGLRARGGAQASPAVAVIRDCAGPDLAAQKRYIEETLGGITGSIFEVGLTLNASSDAPPGDLRRRLDEASRLLDGVVNDIYTAMFRARGHSHAASAGRRSLHSGGQELRRLP